MSAHSKKGALGGYVWRRRAVGIAAEVPDAKEFSASDEIAVTVLLELFKNPPSHVDYEEKTGVLSQRAYAYADAMLAARGEK